MISFYIFIALVIGFVGGFLLGKGAGKKETYQNAERFGWFRFLWCFVAMGAGSSTKMLEYFGGICRYCALG